MVKVKRINNDVRKIVIEHYKYCLLPSVKEKDCSATHDGFSNKMVRPLILQIYHKTGVLTIFIHFWIKTIGHPIHLTSIP